MTTIACNRHEMAADGRVTDNDDTFQVEKVFRINGALYGCAGLYQASVRFMEWVRRGETGRMPRLAKDFSSIKLTPKGIYVISGEDPTWMLCASEFLSIGSGRNLALGAMAHGASPLEAVKTAMKWDIYSGGEPTVLSLVEKT